LFRVVNFFVYAILYTKMSVVLSVRVRKELKEEAVRLGIDLRRVVERALEAEIDRRRRALLEEAVRTIVESMRGVSEEEFRQVIKRWRRRRE